MDREKFKVFTHLMLDNLERYTDLHTGKRSSGKFILNLNSGLKSSADTIEDRNSIVEHITSKVFIAPGKIYPCVDLRILDVSKKGDITIEIAIAGLDPCPFQNGMYDFPGPFNWLTSESIINPKIDVSTDEFQKQKNLIRENFRSSLHKLEQ